MNIRIELAMSVCFIIIKEIVYIHPTIRVIIAVNGYINNIIQSKTIEAKPCKGIKPEVCRS